jgi:hypothetical protein
MSRAPELQAERAEGGLWRVWCCYCGRYHHHSPEPGYRAAHCCEPRSLYTPTGYVLLEPKCEGQAAPAAGRGAS